jgi:hypothetical protein
MDAFELFTIDKGYSKNEFEFVVNQSNGNSHKFKIEIDYWFDESTSFYPSGFGEVVNIEKDLKYKVDKTSIQFIESLDKNDNEIVTILNNSDYQKIYLIIDETFGGWYGQQLINEEIE